MLTSAIFYFFDMCRYYHHTQLGDRKFGWCKQEKQEEKNQENTGIIQEKTPHDFADACMILQNKFLLRGVILFEYISREVNGLRPTSLFK